MQEHPHGRPLELLDASERRADGLDSGLVRPIAADHGRGFGLAVALQGVVRCLGLAVFRQFRQATFKISATIRQLMLALDPVNEALKSRGGEGSDRSS